MQLPALTSRRRTLLAVESTTVGETTEETLADLGVRLSQDPVMALRATRRAGGRDARGAGRRPRVAARS